MWGDQGSGLPCGELRDSQGTLSGLHTRLGRWGNRGCPGPLG